jgi:hypothetical protein
LVHVGQFGSYANSKNGLWEEQFMTKDSDYISYLELTRGPCRLLPSDSAPVLKYGSGPSSDFLAKIVNVDTPLFLCNTQFYFSPSLHDEQSYFVLIFCLTLWLLSTVWFSLVPVCWKKHTNTIKCLSEDGRVCTVCCWHLDLIRKEIAKVRPQYHRQSNALQCGVDWVVQGVVFKVLVQTYRTQWNKYGV